MNEIQAIIRQITASVTFLPLLQVLHAPPFVGFSSRRLGAAHASPPCPPRALTPSLARPAS